MKPDLVPQLELDRLARLATRLELFALLRKVFWMNLLCVALAAAVYGFRPVEFFLGFLLAMSLANTISCLAIIALHRAWEKVHLGRGNSTEAALAIARDLMADNERLRALIKRTLPWRTERGEGEE